MRDLGPALRKKFESTRHQLSKLALTDELETATLYETFKAVLSE